MTLNFAVRRLPQCSTFSKLPAAIRQFTVLAIETSADDTCAAIVDSSRKIHSNIIIKQNDIHEPLGGIWPMGAIGAHQANLPLAIRQALDQAGMDIAKDIDGIAFSRGPGMPGCLSVGMNASKSLAAAIGKPLVGVNHMQGHALTPLLTAWPQEPQFPFMTLLVSGAHTLLVLATSLNSFKILATTTDESIGRTFDKVSRALGLKWTDLGPGDALDKFCAEEQDTDIPVPAVPRPFPNQLKFSFSGIHSHMKMFIESLGGAEKIDEPTKRSIARAFQTGVVRQLEDKVILALDLCRKHKVPIHALVVSGGVASNSFLRERLHDCLLKHGKGTPIPLVFPPVNLCTDNAVMIAWASMHRFLANDTDTYDIGLRPEWSIEESN